MAIPTELVAAILVFLDPDHVLNLRLVSRAFDAVILDPVFAKKVMWRYYGGIVEPQAVLKNGPFFHWPRAFQEAYSMVYLVKEEHLEARVSSSKPITLPSCFGSLSNLKLIQCNNGGFSGSIPAEWSSLASLKVLSLYNNTLTSIPHEFGNLSSLERLVLSNNLIEQIPPTFNQLRNLKSLNLSNNRLTRFDQGICTIPFLSILILSRNQISSQIPDSLASMYLLTILDLSYNNLTGPIPTTWKCNFLSDLNLSHNNLTAQIPPSLCILPRLQHPNLSFNTLTGPIPETWSSPQIRTINLSHNNLTHTIPASLAHLVFFNDLDLAESELTGEVSDGFSGRRCLIWMHGNYLMGLDTVEEWVGVE
ncbi:L domain-like protein [Rhizoclosmatium globosum]|uniref:L domain-like protein n=1 Tax=Rhizoclosmatium globosum TaxID=329046 RepID=A0A1Y2CE86_9FUNG|nr:L domain-like protein [Rhizoclosmatium globosum]|eukprot:ORY45359.1 L domain-like protein [Rhizoclosmatium globosum]